MEQKERYGKLIVTLSIAIPVAVAVLFKVRIKGYDFSVLPPIYASINGITAGLLIAGFIAIKSKMRNVHQMIMKTCIFLSASFLIMYVLYHMTSDPTPYGGNGLSRYIYYFILVTHIALSVAVIPLVLFTFARALAGNFERHRALAKFTFPVWLYVAVTGVIVYLMIRPYYPK